MPDLQRASAIDWLHAVEPEFCRRLTNPVRRIEDLAGVRPLLVELGAALDQLSVRNAGEVSLTLGQAEVAADFREVLVQLGPARFLRLLTWCDSAEVARDGDLLEALLADNRTEAGRQLRATLSELHRQSLLTRIFHPDRLALLLQAVISSQKDTL